MSEDPCVARMDCRRDERNALRNVRENERLPTPPKCHTHKGFEPGGVAIGYMEVGSGERLAITQALTSLPRGPR